MLDYIRFDENRPIIKQLPYDFKSVAILLHPFSQMPIDWVNSKRTSPFQHIYPTEEEMFKYGKPISWEKIIRDCEFKNTKELAMALKTAIHSFRKKYSRPDLAEKLNLQSDMYFPSEDRISIFMIEDIFKVLSSKGAYRLYFSEPIFYNSYWKEITKTNALQISELPGTEYILTDENMDFAFMSIFDSFTTFFLSKDENIDNIIKKMKWEAIICDKYTLVDWYLQP